MTDYVSHAAAHYLMAVRDLLREHGYARGVDVAERVGVSRTGAYLALQALKERGLVREDARHFYTLPDEADALAARLHDSREILTRFFREVLGVAPGEAERNACAIEHHLSPNVADGVAAFLAFVQTHRAGRNLIARFQADRAGAGANPDDADAASDAPPFPRRGR